MAVLELLLWSNTSDATAIQTFMRNAGWTDSNNNPITQIQIDYVNVLTKTPAVFVNGVMTVPPVPYAGYHVNLRLYGAAADALLTGSPFDSSGNPQKLTAFTSITTAIPTLNVPGSAILVTNGPPLNISHMLKDSTTGVYMYGYSSLSGFARQRVWA